MMRVSYAGESFVTTDGVADALLRLVAALGANHTSARIEVPVLALAREGSVEVIQLVAGPASAIVCRSAGPDVQTSVGFDQVAAIDRLNASADALTEPVGVVYAHPYGETIFDFDGLDSI